MPACGKTSVAVGTGPPPPRSGGWTRCSSRQRIRTSLMILGIVSRPGYGGEPESGKALGMGGLVLTALEKAGGALF